MPSLALSKNNLILTIMRLTIFKRLAAGYIAIMMMLLAFSGYVVFQLNRLTRIIHLAADADNQIIQTADSLSTRLTTLVALEKKFWISKDYDFLTLFKKRQHEFIQLLAALEPQLSDHEMQAALAKALILGRSYFKRAELQASGHEMAVTTTYESGRDKLVHELSETLTRLQIAGDRAKDDRIRRSESISARILRIAIGFTAASILVGLAVSFHATRRIVRPIKALRHQTREIAAGRFVTIQALRCPSEICELAEDFNTMSERLKELDMLKEDFVSHVSHKLRTPLTSMREASHMLISGTFDNDPVKRGQLLSIVRDECNRLIVSVNRILDLSRMESGMMEYQFVRTDVNQLIRSVVFKLEPIAQTKRIQLNFEPDPTCPPVMADCDQIHQLLENLIGNALKFTESQGRVTLKVIRPLTAGDPIRVSVTDTGVGINPNQIDVIFNKFRRIENKKDTARGTGLGLAIAKYIVSAHGGDIWVESEVGQGSTFYFSIPPA